MSKLYNHIAELVEEENKTTAGIGGLLVDLLKLQQKQLEELKSALNIPLHR